MHTLKRDACIFMHPYLHAYAHITQPNVMRIYIVTHKHMCLCPRSRSLCAVSPLPHTRRSPRLQAAWWTLLLWTTFCCRTRGRMRGGLPHWEQWFGAWGWPVRWYCVTPLAPLEALWWLLTDEGWAILLDRSSPSPRARCARRDTRRTTSATLPASLRTRLATTPSHFLRSPARQDLGADHGWASTYVVAWPRIPKPPPVGGAAAVPSALASLCTPQSSPGKRNCSAAP